MTTIRLKFRPSSVTGREGRLYFQVIHNRTVRQIGTKIRIYPHEWDERTGTVLCDNGDDEDRVKRLYDIKAKLDSTRTVLEKAKSMLEAEGLDYTVDDFLAKCDYIRAHESFFDFMQGVISQLGSMQKTRTKETYAAALRSFTRFRGGEDIVTECISRELIVRYEAWLRGQGCSLNTSSFYMRILRATYNRAVEQGMTEQRHPFKHVYTGVEKTVKRAIPLSSIRVIRDLDLSCDGLLDFSRDMFLFSFYTRGMSFIDMAFLKKEDLRDGILTYRRRKTGQLLRIRWESEMHRIVRKYDTGPSPYLLPIIRDAGAQKRRQYDNALHLVNSKLKTIAKLAGLSENLTMYVGRHSWASAARNKNVPLAVISEGMGHDSEATTRIYLHSFDASVVDSANKAILRELQQVKPEETAPSLSKRRSDLQTCQFL